MAEAGKNPSLEDFQPPHSTEAEMAVLGSILISPNAVNEVTQILVADDFYQVPHQEIYRVIEQMVAARMTVDLLTVKNELASRDMLEKLGGVGYLVRLTNEVPSTAAAAAYARIVKDKSRLRTLAEVGQQISALVHNPTLTTQEKLESAESMVYRVKQTDRSEFFQPLSHHASEFFQGIERLMNEDAAVAGLETGYSDFDQKTTGFSPGDLIILAARPAMGKSSLALNFALNIARSTQQPVAFFALEMTGEQLVRRLISTLSGVALNEMRQRGLTTAQYDRLLQAAETLINVPVYIDDSAMLSPFDMTARCRRLEKEVGKPAFIVVDYLQLMRSGRNIDNRVQEVSEIARGLKTMAREMKLPVMALSQLSREVEKRPNKRPMLSDLRESGSIEAEADMVSFIYRDKYYQEKQVEDTEFNPNETEVSEIIIAKHRNGPTGTVLLGFQPAFTRFTLLDEYSKSDYLRSQRRRGAEE